MYISLTHDNNYENYIDSKQFEKYTHVSRLPKRMIWKKLLRFKLINLKKNIDI